MKYSLQKVKEKILHLERCGISNPALQIRILSVEERGNSFLANVDTVIGEKHKVDNLRDYPKSAFSDCITGDDDTGMLQAREDANNIIKRLEIVQLRIPSDNTIDRRSLLNHLSRVQCYLRWAFESDSWDEEYADPEFYVKMLKSYVSEADHFLRNLEKEIDNEKK